MRGAEHHLHTRRLVYKKLAQYPNPKFFIRIVDGAVFLIGVVGPIFSIPQLLRVWVNHETVGLSLPSWISYFAFSLVWFVYGIAHKEKLIVLANGIFMIINFSIVLGILMF